MAGIRVTVLVENTASLSLLGEHGLAFWVETPEGAVLLDTGQGEVLLRNVRCLGVPLSEAKAIILSHGHYDHTGGACCRNDGCRAGGHLLPPGGSGPKVHTPTRRARAIHRHA